MVGHMSGETSLWEMLPYALGALLFTMMILWLVIEVAVRISHWWMTR